MCFALILQHGVITDVTIAGSNSHNNNNPAGDGQAGDAGEGNSGKIASSFDKYWLVIILNFVHNQALISIGRNCSPIVSGLDSRSSGWTLAGDIVLCSWARHFPLTVPHCTLLYKWVLLNYWDSRPGQNAGEYGEILLERIPERLTTLSNLSCGFKQEFFCVAFFKSARVMY